MAMTDPLTIVILAALIIPSVAVLYVTALNTLSRYRHD